MIAIFPKIAGCAASGDVERLACLVRDYYADREKFAPRLSLEPVMKRVGIPVSHQALDAAVAVLAASDKKGRFAVHALLSPELREGSLDARFTMAHLLGHFFLHIQPFIARSDLSFGGFRESVAPLVRYEKGLQLTNTSPTDQKREEEADAFAAALLVPQAMLKRAYAKLASVEKTAAFFAVSPGMLQRRLESLGLLTISKETPHFLAAEQRMSQAKAVEEDQAARTAQAMAALLGNPGELPSRKAASSRPGKTPATPASSASPPEGALFDQSSLTTGKANSPARSVVPQAGMPRHNERVGDQQDAVAAHPFSPLIKEADDKLTGMERLRAIAKKLDKGMPNT